MPTSKVTTVLLGVVVTLAAAAGVYTAVHLDYTGPGKLPTAPMDDFEKTDPALIKYREIAPIEIGFEQVRGIAVGPEDRVYVTGDAGLRIFDTAGRRLGDITTETQLGCLAVADDGTIYAASGELVASYGPDGAPKGSWKPADPAPIITSIAVLEDDVFVADAGNRVVLRHDKSGKLINRIGEKDPEKNIDGFLTPSPHLDVAVAPDGLIRVANPGRLRVEVFTPEGDLMDFWGKRSMAIDGFCGCCNPTDIAVLPDGRVVTSEKGLPRVKVYTSEGQFDGVVAGHEAFPVGRCPTGDCTKGRTLDLAVDSKQRILVLDPATKHVRIFVRNEGVKP